MSMNISVVQSKYHHLVGPKPIGRTTSILPIQRYLATNAKPDDTKPTCNF